MSKTTIKWFPDSNFVSLPDCAPCLKQLSGGKAKGWNFNCFMGISSHPAAALQWTALLEKWIADRKRELGICRTLILDKPWLWRVFSVLEWTTKDGLQREESWKKRLDGESVRVTGGFWSLLKKRCILLSLREIRHFFKWQNTLLT